MANKVKTSRLRLFFFRGLGALLPTILTIVILVICYRFVNDNIATPINNGIYRLLINTSWGRSFLKSAGRLEFDIETKQFRKLPDTEWRSYAVEKTGKPDRKLLTELLADVVHPLFGFVIAVLLIFFLGFILATYLGRRVFREFEQFFSNIPIIKFIYPHAKQLVEFFFKEKKMEFSTVVAVEYPRKGLYSIALMTGEGLKQLHGSSGGRLVSVFIPSSPMPMTGYTIFVPFEDVIPLDIEVDEAFRLVVTGGVIVPERQMVNLVEGTKIPASETDEKRSDRAGTLSGRTKPDRTGGTRPKPGRRGGEKAQAP